MRTTEYYCKTVNFGNSQLSVFYHSSIGHNNGELLFATVGIGLVIYYLYKYLTEMANEELKEIY